MSRWFVLFTLSCVAVAITVLLFVAQSDRKQLVTLIERVGGAISMDEPPCVFFAVRGVPSLLDRPTLVDAIPLLRKNRVNCVSFAGTKVSDEAMASFLKEYGNQIKDLDIHDSNASATVAKEIINMRELTVLKVHISVLKEIIDSRDPKNSSLSEVYVYGMKDDAEPSSTLQDAFPGTKIHMRRQDK